MKKGVSGVLIFGIKGGLEVVKEFIVNVKLVIFVMYVVDVWICVIYFVSMTYR